ncbi:hypothetical protein [Roseateles asaccharophilus]|uniref:Uncharacterized protein n=1 Tax=Roseateles asaccharophilus TaxID=582607 RepID=A0ABU2AC25_9BURK|nr:hypothetical protein [Roseateles asaccharophilus]MDR7334757.1 hypothetical protein [Roseateles asaccharophilus]
MKILVGDLQRPENQCWCGFPADAFGYNGSPTSSCHTFCWKARHLFDVPFFYVLGTALRAFTSLRDLSLPRNGSRR